MRPDLGSGHDWLVLDPPGRIVLLLVSTLFLFCSFYAVGYLRHRQERSNRVFCVCLLAFLGIMSLVTWSHHLGLMWVAIEATTLVTAPLIYFNRTAAQHRGHLEIPAGRLGRHRPGAAGHLLPRLCLAACGAGIHADLREPAAACPAAVQALASRGVRPAAGRLRHQDGAGPDAHLEARCLRRSARRGRGDPRRRRDQLRVPGPPADLPDLRRRRRRRLCLPAAAVRWACSPWPWPGCSWSASAISSGCWPTPASSTWASWRWAWASAAPALFGTLLHVVTNGMTKGVLFLSAGNIHRAYGSKNTDQVRGAMRRLPLVRLAVPGRISGHHRLAALRPVHQRVRHPQRRLRRRAGSSSAGLFLFLLLVVFIGMGATVLQVVQGRPPAEVRAQSVSRRLAHRRAGRRLHGAGAAAGRVYSRPVDRAAQRRRPFSGGPAMTRIDRQPCHADQRPGRSRWTRCPTLALDDFEQTIARRRGGRPARGGAVRRLDRGDPDVTQLYVVLADDEQNQLACGPHARSRAISFPR